jgi:K+-transporting ATPase ATPase B chain
MSIDTLAEASAPSPDDDAGSKPRSSIFDPAIIRPAVLESFRKLDPRVQARNPVMFIVGIGALWTTILFFQKIGSATAANNAFAILIAVWLWFTVLFANFAEAVAEGRGKAQAETLRRTRSETVAIVIGPDGTRQ